jgi:hypothetical protein
VLLHALKKNSQDFESLLKKRKSRKPEFSAERLLTGEYAMYIFIITLSTFLIIEIVSQTRWFVM